MSIRVKLVISNILMILIPLGSSFFLFMIVIKPYVDDSNKKDHASQMEKYMADVIESYTALFFNATKFPDKFKDKQYLADAEKKLQLGSGIAIIIDDKVYYITDKYNKTDLKQQLIQMGKKKQPGENFLRNLKDYKKVHVAYNDLKFSSGAGGRMYLLTDLSQMETTVSKIIKKFSTGMIIIFLGTNILLTFFVSRSIIKPVKKLKYGAEQIKDGNLSFVIRTNLKDEIGQACRAFEEMRFRLRESLENQLRVDEDRQEFIASISHDLKTPITSIKGYVEGIMDGVADTPEKMDKYIKTIYSKAVNMDKLIEDLTFYSNQSLKKIPFNFEKISIKRFIDDFVDEMQIEIEEKGILMQCEYLIQNRVEVMADSEKLKRVVINIIDNSIKYMDKDDKQINIDVKLIDDNVRIGINDNGEGVKPENIDSIFNRFYRVDTARTTLKGGSGLGLAIAKQIIDQHGGKIWAESEYGKSMSIYFELKQIGGYNEKEDIDN